MKHLLLSVIALVFVNFNTIGQDLAPYIKVGESTASIQQVTDEVTKVLKDNSFSVLGIYNPSYKNTLAVIVFTRSDLRNTVVKVKDRGALASTMKIGLVKKDQKVIISYTNPEYFLRAYLNTNYNSYKSILSKFNADLKATLSTLGSEFKPFGGAISADRLGKYHYKMMMPYFTDPVELNEFASFDEGLKIIINNLNAKKGNTVKVYSVVYENEEIAVFGVGLQSKDDGESYFLPKIGEDHVAALPYEIILQGNTATMLHGKYRIALHWPELTMGTFMKIMSTPGDIEDTLEAVCK